MTQDTYDWTEHGRPCVTVIEAVAEAVDRDALDLPPLQESIDTDALDAILIGSEDSPDSRVKVSFQYAGCDVLLDSDGSVAVLVDSDGVE